MWMGGEAGSCTVRPAGERSLNGNVLGMVKGPVGKWCARMAGRKAGTARAQSEAQISLHTLCCPSPACVSRPLSLPPPPPSTRRRTPHAHTRAAHPAPGGTYTQHTHTTHLPAPPPPPTHTQGCTRHPRNTTWACHRHATHCLAPPPQPPTNTQTPGPHHTHIRVRTHTYTHTRKHTQCCPLPGCDTMPVSLPTHHKHTPPPRTHTRPSTHTHTAPTHTLRCPLPGWVSRPLSLPPRTHPCGAHAPSWHQYTTHLPTLPPPPPRNTLSHGPTCHREHHTPPRPHKHTILLHFTYHHPILYGFCIFL